MMQVKMTADVRTAEMMLDNIEFGTRIPRTTINSAIRTEVKAARRKVASGAKSLFANDPKRTAQGIRAVVYKNRVFGGYLTIISPHRLAGGGDSTTDGHWMKGGRSGITRTRPIGKRTTQIRGYKGVDRAFIFRFNDQGTGDRATKSLGSRGSLTGKRYFKPASVSALEEASTRIGSRIEKLILRAAQKK